MKNEVNGVTEDTKPLHEEELVQTISVKPPKPETPAKEILKRTLILTAISAGIAAMVKKTIIPVLMRYQPENPPIKVPDEVGFFSAGAGGAVALAYMQKKINNRKMSRRDFFPVIGSGIGALVGGMAAKPATLNPQAEPGHSGEESNDGGEIDS